MGLGIVGLLRDYFEELDGGRPLLLLEPDERQMILRLRICRVSGKLGLKFFLRSIQIAAAGEQGPQAEMRGGYLGIEFQGTPELLRGFIDLVLAGVGVAPKNMHGRGIRLHAQELLKNSLGLLILMCAREGRTQGEKQFGRIRMYGPGATQRAEGGLILASLDRAEPKIQVDVGKVNSACRTASNSLAASAKRFSRNAASARSLCSRAVSSAEQKETTASNRSAAVAARKKNDTDKKLKYQLQCQLDLARSPGPRDTSKGRRGTDR